MPNLSPTQITPLELHARLDACRINFDPQAEHGYGAAAPEKVAFVPVELLQAIKDFLRPESVFKLK